MIAVALGQLLSGLPHVWIRLGSAALFLVFGVLLLVRSGERLSHASPATARPVLTAFTLIFLAEWGDMTQIAAAALVASHTARLGRLGASLAVFVGAVLGLWLGTALATVIGFRAKSALPERAVRLAAGVCFLLVAAYPAFLQR